jgi:hypothetical protein
MECRKRRGETLSRVELLDLGFFLGVGDEAEERNIVWSDNATSATFFLGSMRRNMN